jgi:hypothetical protein
MRLYATYWVSQLGVVSIDGHDPTFPLAWTDGAVHPKLSREAPALVIQIAPSATPNDAISALKRFHRIIKNAFG